MKRFRAGTVAAVLVLGVVGFFPAAASAAPAQADPAACFPGSDADYPPVGAAVEIQASLSLLSGQLNPGARGTLVITGATPDLTYCGILTSTPVTLPETPAAGTRLTYNVAVPADFELGAMHHIDLFRAQKQVGSFDFCVDRTGAIAPASACEKAKMGPGGPLAKTGTSSTMEILRIAVVALGLGVGALYLKRRRDRATA